jgi:hypothetical protein
MLSHHRLEEDELARVVERTEDPSLHSPPLLHHILDLDLQLSDRLRGHEGVLSTTPKPGKHLTLQFEWPTTTTTTEHGGNLTPKRPLVNGLGTVVNSQLVQRLNKRTTESEAEAP